MMRLAWCTALAAASMCLCSKDASAIVVRVELQPELEEIDAPVFPQQGVMVVTPIGTTITKIHLSNRPHYQPRSLSPRVLMVVPAEDATPGTLTITLRGGRHITIQLSPTDIRWKAASRVECYEPGNLPRSEPTTSELPLGKWMSGAERVDEPRELSWHQDALSLSLQLGFVVHTKDSILLPVRLQSSDTRYPLKEIQLLDHRDVAMDAALIYADHDLLTGKAIVQPGHPLAAVFVISKTNQIQKGWTLVALPSTRLPPARFGFKTSRARSPLQDRIAITLHGLGGAGQLDDGVGNGKRAWTTVQGAGVQTRYGMARNFSVEGSLDFARTSAVTFSNATWEQLQGELTVRETSVRLLAAGLLHPAGQRWIPYARLALGARLTKRTTRMDVRSEEQYRAGALFGFGGGLNVMLGKRVMAGMSFTYITPIGGDDTTQGFEVGFSLSALWSVQR